MFFRPHSHNSHVKQLAFHHVLRKHAQSPIGTYPIIALHEQQEIFYVPELYSTNKIPFSHIRLRSITCHFLVNNQNVITYSNRFIQPHWKKTHLELNATNITYSNRLSNPTGKKLTWNLMLLMASFHAILPCFDFSTDKIHF